MAYITGPIPPAAMQVRVALGPRAEWRVVRVGDVPVAVPPPGQCLCAEAQGFNLHAGVHVAAGRPKQLERLCRYLLRPPFAPERLARLPDGGVLVRLKRPWPDGTRALVYEPLDFLSKICALVPPPRRHLVHYHGVLEPNSKWRAEVVPEPDVAGPEAPPALAGPDKPAYRMSWAEMTRRTFAADVLACPCGGRKRFQRFVFDPGALPEPVRPARWHQPPSPTPCHPWPW